METIFNGVNLDKTIPGFTTVNITGRELIAPELIIVNGKVVDKKYPPRTITVNFMINGKNKDEFRESLANLNSALQTNSDKKLQFTDEDWEYEGRLSGVVNPPVDYFQGVGSFNIYCEFPFRILEDRALNGTNIKFDDGLYRINEIIITTAPSNVTIQNASTGDKISIKNIEGQEILFDFSNDKITSNGTDITSDLIFESSNWSDFKIIDEPITLTLPSSGSVKYTVLDY